MEIVFDVPAEATALVRTLEKAGYEAWFVGGFVRNAILEVKRSPVVQDKSDIDIACSAPASETMRICAAAGYGVHETGLAHGTVTAVVNGKPFEVTTYRIDGIYSDNRHPDYVVFTDNIELDLVRRDFTMNAIAWHPDRGLLDPFGGIEDIKEGCIRAVGDPKTRFEEDALRILRAIRFAAQLGFSIHSETYAMMELSKWRLSLIPVERTRKELDKILLGLYVQNALMANSSILFAVIPELAACKDFDQHSSHHCFDVFDHTAWTVHYMPATLIGRWAALCHDLGKPAAFRLADGKGHFIGHEIIGAKIAHTLALSQNFSAMDADRIAKLVRFHNMHGEPTEKTVKRMLARLGGDVSLYRMLLDLQRADALSHAPGHTGRVHEADRSRALLKRILDEGQVFSLDGLAVNGNDLIELGMKEGPEIGTTLETLLSLVIEGKLPNDRQRLLDKARKSIR